MQELASNPAVKADATSDVVHVGSDSLAQVRHFVDEGNFHGQERVRCVLGQLRRLEPGQHDRRFDEVERPIELLENLAGAFGLGANHHAIGPHEIANRIAFTQKLRVRGNVELEVGADATGNLGNRPARADRHRRFGDDDGIALERARDLFGGRVHITEVRSTVAATSWGPDRDEHGLHVLQRRLEVVSKTQPFRFDVLGDQRIEARFVDRHLIDAQSFELYGIDFHDRHL